MLSFGIGSIRAELAQLAPSTHSNRSCELVRPAHVPAAWAEAGRSMIGFLKLREKLRDSRCRLWGGARRRFVAEVWLSSAANGTAPAGGGEQAREAAASR
jgi:hypothetical protein